MSELLAFGKKAIKIALGKGAEEAEAYLNMSSATSIEIERGQIVRSIKRVDQGLGVRAIYRKAVGFSYINTLTDNNVGEAAARAFRAARASKPEKDWKSFSSPKSFCETRNTFDRRVVEVSSDELAETAAVMLGAVEGYDRRVLAVAGATTGQSMRRCWQQQMQPSMGQIQMPRCL